PAGELDVGKRDHARARVGGLLEDFFDGNMPPALRVCFFIDHDELHAAGAGQLHPWIDVGRVFDAGGDDAVPKLPVESVGDDADPLAGVLDEGDLVAMGVDDRPGQHAELFDVAVPAREEIRLAFRFGGVFSHGVGGGAGHRRNAGVVEKVPFPQDREFIYVADEVRDVAGEVVHAR